MKAEHFQEAISIITASGTSTVSFNTPIDSHVAHTYPILIHKSNATLINRLVKEGFSLSMTDKGLSVDKY